MWFRGGRPPGEGEPSYPVLKMEHGVKCPTCGELVPLSGNIIHPCAAKSKIFDADGRELRNILSEEFGGQGIDIPLS